MMSIIVAAVLGMLSWSFAEYGLHHWNGHLMKGRTLFSREHLKHHADPDYFAPTAIKLRMATPVLAAMFALTIAVAGVALGLAYSLAFAATYVGYEVLHRRIHTHPPRNAFGRWARKHHLAHHFTNPRENHGVTSPLWDIIFRTRTPVAQVRVPARLATVWLLEDGEVAAPHRGDYVLSGRRARRATSEATAPVPVPEADVQAAYAGMAPE